MKVDELKITLPLYEGPLDLLLDLLRRQKLDIYDIPIARITEQYLSYLHLMEEMNVDLASEFLVIAAQLIYIKSRLLLPGAEAHVVKAGLKRTQRRRLKMRFSLIERGAVRVVPSAAC